VITTDGNTAINLYLNDRNVNENIETDYNKVLSSKTIVNTNDDYVKVKVKQI